MRETGLKFIDAVKKLNLAEDGLFILVIVALAVFAVILFYNDIKKDLKYTINKDALTGSDIVDKMIAFLKEYENYPRLEIIAFSTFARFFYPKRYEVRGQETFSFVLDKCHDIRYFERSKFAFNDGEIKLLIKALYEKLKTVYPEAEIDYDRYKLTIKFYEQKTGFVMR